MSLSGFYAWHQRQPSWRAIGNAVLIERIRMIHAESGGTYGRARVRAELIDQGVKVSSKRGGRLMRLAGLRGVSRRRGFIITTRRDHRQGSKFWQTHLPPAPWAYWVTKVGALFAPSEVGIDPEENDGNTFRNLS